MDCRASLAHGTTRRKVASVTGDEAVAGLVARTQTDVGGNLVVAFKLRVEVRRPGRASKGGGGRDVMCATALVRLAETRLSVGQSFLTLCLAQCLIRHIRNENKHGTIGVD